MDYMWESHVNESQHVEESHTHEFARHMRVTYGVTVSHMNEFARIRRAKYVSHI